MLVALSHKTTTNQMQASRLEIGLNRERHLAQLRSTRTTRPLCVSPAENLAIVSFQSVDANQIPTPHRPAMEVASLEDPQVIDGLLAYADAIEDGSRPDREAVLSEFPNLQISWSVIWRPLI